MNTTLKVDRVNYESSGGLGPKSLVVKKYGGNIFTEKAKEIGINSPWVQSLIFYEHSRCGWGPKLYGLFEEGRVEEFVECHCLTAAEAFTPEVAKDAGKAFARFHSHKLPLKQKPRDLVAEVIGSVNSLKDSVREFVNSGQVEASELAKFPIDEILNFPHQSEYEWINSSREKIRERIVLCALDTNYLNRLVRTQVAGDENESRILIIDHDASAYSYRGYDLAGHCVNRMFDVANEDVMSGFDFPSESERTSFLIAYLDECSKLFDDFQPQSLDSIENVTLEMDFNICANLLACLYFSLEWIKLMTVVPKMPVIIEPLLKLYKEQKERFMAKYPSIGSK